METHATGGLIRTLVFGMAIAGFAVPTAPSTFAQEVVHLATAPASPRWDEVITRARIAIDSVRRANNVPGISVAVAVDGKVVWSEGFGMADVETGTPVTPLTRFRIGSISKSMTAVGLGLLIEEGRIDIDAPVQEYVPDFPEKEKGVITTRLLGGHLAGVRHYRGDEMLSSAHYATVAEGLAIFSGDTLQTPPGTAYSYSSYGWNLLSAAMEGASGEPFLAFMSERVFEPLDMRLTLAEHPDSIIIGRTGYYGRGSDGAILNEPFVDNSYKWAGGGFLSTPEDLLKLADGLVYGGFLRPETLEILWTSQRTMDGRETGYGVGWRVGSVGPSENPSRMVSHSGGSVGGNSWMGILPEDGVALAITSNISGAGWQNLPVRLLEAFLEVKRASQD